MKDLRDVETRLGELAERRNAAQDQLDRIEIRAPRSGIVHDMQVHTIGGVISPAEILMTIVPSDEKLAIEIRLAPTDRDQVQIGQKAHLRFSAFNQHTTPEFTGEMTDIAAELTREPQTGVYLLHSPPCRYGRPARRSHESKAGAGHARRNVHGNRTSAPRSAIS